MPLTISTITPNSGLTRGKDLVTLAGTDFDLHPHPPTFTGAPLGKPSPSLKVLFDGVESPDVAVYSASEIVCAVPTYQGDPKDLPKAVDVVVQNLLNPATATLANGFTYQHPDLTSATQVDLERFTKAVLRELRRRLPVHVVSRVHTDFDADTGDTLQTVELARLPALQISGPTLSRSDGVFQNRQPRYEGGFRVKQPTRHDLTYSLRFYDDSNIRLLRMLAEIVSWQDEGFSCAVEMPDASRLSVRMVWSSRPQVEQQSAGKDNISTATASLTLVGVGLERIGGLKLHEINTPQTFEVWSTVKV